MRLATHPTVTLRRGRLTLPALSGALLAPRLAPREPQLAPRERAA